MLANDVKDTSAGITGSAGDMCYYEAILAPSGASTPVRCEPQKLSTADPMKLNQVLRLKVEEHVYKGLIVNISDEAMLVATTSQEGPSAPNGTIVQGEIFKADGLYHFTSRLLGFQLMPVLVLILDRPKAIRRIQRRREPRHAVSLSARLIYISADRSINEEVTVRNLSFGGLEAECSAAPPQGMHCVVLLRKDGHELSTICQVMHAITSESGFRLGLSFVEMAREDLELLHNFISLLDQTGD
jgi:c-di-GMP-binding flagellar brake protein YcgR